MIYIEELQGKTGNQEQSEIGRKLLLKGLRNEYGFSTLPEIGFSENGKPFFKDFPGIHFNISHCERAVVCAIFPFPVGIDVECINPFDEDLASFVSSAEEFGEVLQSPEPDVFFTVLWTKKESYCKLLGEGLASRDNIRNILKNNNTTFNIIINISKKFVVTFCFQNHNGSDLSGNQILLS